MRATDEDTETAERLRWGVSRLSSRLRAEQPGNGESLTRLAASVLANVLHGRPSTPTELAAVEGLQAQSLTRVLNDLEERGCIIRVRDEQDRRRQEVHITTKGVDALREHVRDGNAWLAAALHKTLSPTERGLLRLAAELMQQLAVSEMPAGPAGGRTAHADNAPEGAAPAL
ncbi:MarR family winged helix-turn-helix transcriptional regulator [Streptomyces sp. NPDC058773]|uniref:MarR family winged helix-turn-helix transcriptional regulator n=1 Tax=Streptomyces sp. NPDC058773 TaxID=3346632 RepID=UPI00369F5368